MKTLLERRTGGGFSNAQPSYRSIRPAKQIKKRRGGRGGAREMKGVGSMRRPEKDTSE